MGRSVRRRVRGREGVAAVRISSLSPRRLCGAPVGPFHHAQSASSRRLSQPEMRRAQWNSVPRIASPRKTVSQPGPGSASSSETRQGQRTADDADADAIGDVEARVRRNPRAHTRDRAHDRAIGMLRIHALGADRAIEFSGGGHPATLTRYIVISLGARGSSALGAGLTTRRRAGLPLVFDVCGRAMTKPAGIATHDHPRG